MKISQVTLALLLTIAIASRVDAAIASWDRNTEPDVAGYLLSYGTEPGDHTSTIDVGNVTTFQFNLEPGRRYYVVVRAYNTQGYLSEKSSEATIDIPASTPDSYPPPPPPSGTSVNNTLVPPATQIVDTTGGIWTLGANNATLRNGVQVAGWSGTKLLWYNAAVYNLGLDGSWYRWDSSGRWVNLNTSVQPGPTTPPPGTSANNTLVPPATQIVDATGGIWTLGANNATLRNGVQQAGWSGTKLLWYNATVYNLGLDGSWYRWDSSGRWVNLNTSVQPGPAAPPPSTSPDNTLVPPATQVVDAAGAVWTIGSDNLLLRNGTNQGGGRGTKLLWYRGVVYTFGMDNSWYRWNNDGANSGWVRLNTTTQPGT